MDISFKLEKVQMTPGSFNSIMNTAVRFSAFGTRELAARFKIYVNIKLFSFGTKFYSRNVPRIFEI